jgi:hypothetical protein
MEPDAILGYEIAFEGFEFSGGHASGIDPSVGNSVVAENGPQLAQLSTMGWR